MGEPYAHPEVLVSADWVEAHLEGSQGPHRRERRGHPALRSGSHSRGRPDRLAGRSPGPACSRLHQRREVRRVVLEGGDRQRHDRRLLRRQVELVGLLRLLGVQAVRAPRLPDPERRPQALADQGRPTTTEVPSYPADHDTRSREARRSGSGSSATRSRRTPRRGCR